MVKQLIRRKHAKTDFDALTQSLRELYQSIDGNILVEFKKADNGRSLSQNNLLWKWHSELAKHIFETQGGVFSVEDIHEYVVGKLLPKEPKQLPDGEFVIRRTETKKLGVKRFAEFLTKYEVWATDVYKVQFTQPVDLYFEALMKNDI